MLISPYFKETFQQKFYWYDFGHLLILFGLYVQLSKNFVIIGTQIHPSTDETFIKFLY